MLLFPDFEVDFLLLFDSQLHLFIFLLLFAFEQDYDCEDEANREEVDEDIPKLATLPFVMLFQ